MGIVRTDMYQAAWACFLVLGGGAALADPPAGDGNSVPSEPKTLPQDSFFSSLKQSVSQSDDDVVRGHFDLGSPPNVHRYYCLVNAKTGRRQNNGVVGDPVPLKNGMTGLKNGAVSFYRCANAESEGMLVTDGYALSGVAAQSAPPAPKPPQAATAPPLPTALPAVAPNVLRSDVPADQIDVAGIKLGMSPDQVRAVLKAKKLLDYNEAAETLSYLDSAKGTMQPVANGRFVNVIAAWTPPVSSATDSLQADGEYFEVMFTPVPGKERAMGIVHTVGYSPANAPREVALESGLTKKYGGDAAGDLAESPTWRYLSGGGVQLGDLCNRRTTFGGLGNLIPGATRANLALKHSADDFQSQIDRCGAAIVTEDHHTANGGALREDRIVTRFTVSAYNAAIALDGAKAASQLVQSAGGSAKKSSAAQPANNL